jgi:hypothetical protein
MSKRTAAIYYIYYIVGTFLMTFGWLCALAQGDAPQQQPRIGGIVVIFAIALALLSLSACRLLRMRRVPQIVMAFGVGVQALVCLYVIAIEFTL